MRLTIAGWAGFAIGRFAEYLGLCRSGAMGKGSEINHLGHNSFAISTFYSHFVKGLRRPLQVCRKPLEVCGKPLGMMRKADWMCVR